MVLIFLMNVGLTVGLRDFASIPVYDPEYSNVRDCPSETTQTSTTGTAASRAATENQPEKVLGGPASFQYRVKWIRWHRTSRAGND